MTNHKQPVFEQTMPRGIRAKVWINEKDDQSWFSPQLERSYKKDDAWATSLINLRRDDIPLAIEALKAMHEFIVRQESKTIDHTDAEEHAA